MKKFTSLALGMFFLLGCASQGVHLKPDQISAVKRISFMAAPGRESPQILDHTEVWSKTYTGGQFGAIGSALEGLVLSIEASSAKKDSLGGDAGKFLKESKSINIQKDIETHLQKKLKSAFEVTDPSVMKSACRWDEKTCSVGEYLEKASALGSDLFIYLKYVYGVAAFKGSPASAAVDAEVYFYQLPSRKAIFKKDISSAEAFTHESGIDQLMADDLQLFNQYLLQAVDAMTLLVANELDLFTGEVKEARIKYAKNSDPFARHGISTNVISMVAVSCNNPVRLEQSCNGFSGANKRIKINKVKTSIAGSKDGRAVMAMWGVPMKLVDKIIQAAEDNNITIERATLIGSKRKPDGYILFANGDLYSVLSQYSY